MKQQKVVNQAMNTPERRRESRRLYLKKNWQLYALMVLPLIFIFVFKYGAYAGLSIAFKDYKVARGYAASPWVGWDIFRQIFSHKDFWPSVKNTLFLNILNLVFTFPMPIILALLLNEVKVKWFKKVTQTLLYLPHFLSWVIIGSLAYQLFSLSNGVVNALLTNIGASPVPFLQDDTWWLITYIFISVWQSMGWGTIIYLAAITSVNTELYEAARVDGAGRWKQCVHVTFPCIRGTIVTLLIMNLGKLMQGSFEQIYALMNAKATKYTTVIPVLVYRWGIEAGKFSRATALGLFQSVIGLILVLASDYISKKLGEDGLI